MTYNIRHAEGADGWISNRRVALAITDARPDVVGLNEVWMLSGVWDQPRLLADLVGMEHVFEANHQRWIQGIGNEVLTRGAVASSENLAVPGGIETRGCLLARIDIDGTTVAFASTHLSLGRRTRTAQLAFLAETLPRDIPLVLAGDLNCEARELAPLGELLTVSEPPKTFPSVRPRRALDHILFSRHWALVSQEAVRTRASDHLPLVAELALREA